MRFDRVPGLNALNLVNVLTVSTVVLLAVSGCRESTPSDPRAGANPAPAPPPASSSNTLGSVDGKAVPGAIVVLEPADAREFPPPEVAVMDQVSLSFTPEMLFVRTGQAVEFRNSDDTLHNVHVGNSDTKEPSFNVAIPTGEKYRYTFVKDGFYHVGCDIHPAMAAEILSVATPFVMTAQADGGFQFVDVPPGKYRLRMLAGATQKEKDVEVKAGANAVEM